MSPDSVFPPLALVAQKWVNFCRLESRQGTSPSFSLGTTPWTRYWQSSSILFFRSHKRLGTNCNQTVLRTCLVTAHYDLCKIYTFSAVLFFLKHFLAAAVPGSPSACYCYLHHLHRSEFLLIPMCHFVCINLSLCLDGPLPWLHHFRLGTFMSYYPCSSLGTEASGFRLHIYELSNMCISWFWSVWMDL